MLVAEDGTFWQHDGVDYEQLRDAVEVERGARASSCAARAPSPSSWRRTSISRPSRNPVRKLRELLIARRLEAELSKQRILELYLNVIEWGDGIYGAEAAARQYFRTSAVGAQAAGSLAARGRHHQSALLRYRPPFDAAAPAAADDPGPSRTGATAAGSGREGRAADAVPALPGIPAAPPDALPGEIVPSAPAPEGRPRGPVSGT